ncbi:phosphodiester glycosidase family protein [Vagococcus sp. BWB3-3]|uniref:Phosphodiester glycosidase family protein n=1 Tax=Vagococcus allomyrinae TaxID=2794353 RepID=A0A940ST54_9ENTE|nr:phosphodiester glycosidase family protein [Vagococcus allomyrinae]MBP1042747.1 phosphodiester glycosidase family protein [Vagococcus allomyrinae]
MKQLFNWLKKPFRLGIIYSLCLTLTVGYVLLDTFVIPKELASNDANTQSLDPNQTTTKESATTTAATITDTSYQDENISIAIATERANDTTFYVVDIQLSSADYLKTAFAQGSYGRNIKETTSTIAKEQQAILAINGDYYGFRDTGYVLRNGETYRDTPWEGTDALVIDSAGNFSTYSEDDNSLADILTAQNAQQVLSFGPTLIQDSQIVISTNTEVSQSKSSNPRTAIGQIDDRHYVMIVSDGRTDESEGLSLYQLAEEFASRGASIAYNLDGGGSSTLWFNGQVINQPTDGRQIKERSVSDIIYIGY